MGGACSLPSALPRESAATGPDLLVVALEAELLLLQRLLLGLQVGPGQAHVIQELLHPAHVRLHQQAQGTLTLMPAITGHAGSTDAKESPSQQPRVPTFFTTFDPRLFTVPRALVQR